MANKAGDKAKKLTDKGANLANKGIDEFKKMDDEAREMVKPQKFDENTSIRGLDLLNQYVDMNQDINKSVDHAIEDAAHKAVNAGAGAAKMAEDGADGIMSGIGKMMPEGGIPTPKPSSKKPKQAHASPMSAMGDSSTPMPAMSPPGDTQSGSPLQMLSQGGLDAFGSKSSEHNGFIDSVKEDLKPVSGIIEKIAPIAEV